MRLASKIFLTSAIVIVVLAGVAALSLRAINRLVPANRDIVTRTVPAARWRSRDPQPEPSRVRNARRMARSL